MKAITVFCGAHSGNDAVYGQQAKLMGQEIAKQGIILIYGGGKIGLMGTLADAVLEAQGSVIGVIPEYLKKREVAHLGLSELHVVGSMHERKAKMFELSDAFIAMPGGFGTLDEFCEVLTWSYLKMHAKPCGLLNVQGYYDGFLTFLKHANQTGFIPKQHLDLITCEVGVSDLLNQLKKKVA